MEKYNGKIEFVEVCGEKKYTKNPLSTMGIAAGICYNSLNPNRFINIAKRCLAEGHSRTSEYPDIMVKISGYSAKMIRELYTHKVGTTFLQMSTRYVDYSGDNFEIVIPPEIYENEEACKIFVENCEATKKSMEKLKDLGVKVEDYSMLLPLTYQTVIVAKMNLRAIIHLFSVRSCACAYHEFRKFMNDLKNLILSTNCPEWKFLADNYFQPKCEVYGFCEEENRCCGRKEKKSVFFKKNK